MVKLVVLSSVTSPGSVAVNRLRSTWGIGGSKRLNTTGERMKYE
jgi:hypothetical protein